VSERTTATSKPTTGMTARAAAPLRLAVTTPWYPGSNNPFAGVFVLHAIEAVQSVAPGAIDTTIYHAEDWPTPVDPLGSRVTRWAMREMTDRADNAPRAVREGTLRRVRVPARPGRGYLRHAQDHVDAVRRILPGGRIVADVIHAHEGLFGGLVATRLAAPGVPVVVTEHDTRLRKLLTAPEARAAYGEILERADRFYAVGQMLADQVRGYVPMLADKVEVIPNAVAFDALPMRAEQVSALSRWLYVGRLLQHKGVMRLVTAFAECARTRPELSLTIIGGGPLAGALQERATELGVRNRITFRGPVAHDEVQKAMRSHDLLVHLSERETFGMTLVEAVSCGLPVLATRSGGPQETMAGLGTTAGRLIDVGADVFGWDIEPVVEAFGQMEAEIDGLDLPWARAQLYDRYSQESVGHQLLTMYQDLAGARQSEDPMTDQKQPDQTRSVQTQTCQTQGAVLLMALTSVAARQTVNNAHFLLEQGVPAIILTAEPIAFHDLELNPRVPIIDLTRPEVASLPHRGKRALTRLRQFGLPGRAVNAAGVQAYKVFRPLLLWRAAERYMPAHLDLSRVREIVLADAHAVPLGWHIARSHPDLPISFSLDRDAYRQAEGETLSESAVPESSSI